MATISISYPDEYEADTASAMQEFLGEDGVGLAGSQAVNTGIRRFLKGRVRAYRRRNSPGVSAAVGAATVLMTEKEVAARAAVTSRKNAELAEDAAVETAFGSNS